MTAARTDSRRLGLPLVCHEGVNQDRTLSLRRFANMNALKEIYRVLQPTGVFGMIWNIEDCKLCALLDLIRADLPQTTLHCLGKLHQAGRRLFEISRGLSTTRNHAFGMKIGGQCLKNSRNQTL